VGTRRDNITGKERAEIAMEVMPTSRPYGTITRLAREHAVSRQTIYTISGIGRDILLQNMAPGQHGPKPEEKVVLVNRDRLARSAVMLTWAGVSQRDIGRCCEALLDTSVSAAWVNAELAKRETIAAQVNLSWKPSNHETLSGDEIYSNGSPNLMVIGNDTLYIYALTRQATCDGETWACVLLDTPDSPQFSSDAGTGLAAGAKTAGITVHQLDWDHLLRPTWGQVSRLEQQAYAGLDAVEERAAQFSQSQTTKRLEKHLSVWESLSAKTQEKIVQHDQFSQLAQQVDDQFALIDLNNGQLRDPLASAAVLRSVGMQLSHWQGHIYEKLSANLTHWADDLFAYHTGLSQALQILTNQWGAEAIQALSCVWQIEADQKRHPKPLTYRQNRQTLWEMYLGKAVDCLGLEQLDAAWKDVCSVFSHSWRGSMLCECVNSLLRPVFDRRKSSDQGCLELFRFLHNAHPFARGKRIGHSPAELAGIQLPDDPFSLLGLAPKCQSNFTGF
jgi:hypothetical protein